MRWGWECILPKSVKPRTDPFMPQGKSVDVKCCVRVYTSMGGVNRLTCEHVSRFLAVKSAGRRVKRMFSSPVLPLFCGAGAVSPAASVDTSIQCQQFDMLIHTRMYHPPKPG